MKQFSQDLEKIIAYIQDGYRAEIHCDFSMKIYVLDLWTNEYHKRFLVPETYSLDDLKETIHQAMKRRYSLNMSS